jgi:hypothetical protein
MSSGDQMRKARYWDSINDNYAEMTDRVYAKVLEATTKYRWPVTTACSLYGIDPAKFSAKMDAQEPGPVARKVRRRAPKTKDQYYISDQIANQHSIKHRGERIRKIEKMGPGQI